MTDYQAKIRAKGLETTGFTEELIEKLWSGGAGRYGLAIVEYRVEDIHGPSADGKKRADLVLSMVEPATAEKVEDILRELSRAMAAQRRAESGETLPGMDDVGPSLDDTLGAANALIEKTEDGATQGIWNGDTEEAPTGPVAVPDPFEIIEDGDKEDTDEDPEDEPDED